MFNAIEETPTRYANDPQKEEKARRTDRSTKTPIANKKGSTLLLFL
jgi:hypothetical protein